MSRIAGVFAIGASCMICTGWVGVNVKPLKKDRSELAATQSGTYYQLSDKERKELVWMAKAANAAYPNVPKPLGYRSLTIDEWKRCTEGCDEFVYTEDGYFKVGDSGLRGRIMVGMLNDEKVILSFSGTDMASLKDWRTNLGHALRLSMAQYAQSLKLMNGVLSLRSRTTLWIVGHSLGGSLATYVALHIPSTGPITKCATFNGYGVAKQLLDENVDLSLAAGRIRNVYCTGDPVYNHSEMIVNHYGPSYSLTAGKGLSTDMSIDLSQHGLEQMLKLMIASRTGWPGM